MIAGNDQEPTDREPTDREPDATVSKAAARAVVRRLRRERTLDHRGHCRYLETFLDGAVVDGDWIVVYDALPDEVDLAPLQGRHPDPASRFAITRTPDRGHALTVHPVDGPTERHPYGYRQPSVDAPRVPDERIGAVLVPGLAFAPDGARLGRGKGYYDRFLARLLAIGRTVHLIGVTADIVVHRIPASGHDVPMTHLSTSHGVLSVPIADGTVATIELPAD